MDEVPGRPSVDRAATNGAHERRGILARVAGAATERLVDTVDPDIVLDHIDIDALLARVDINAVLDRIDIDRLLARVDMAALIERAGVPELVASTTGRMAESGIDLVRRQMVGMDLLAARIADRLAFRSPRSDEAVPPRLTEAAAVGRGSQRVTVTGRYAGVVTRALASLLDVGVIAGSYTLLLAGLDYLLTTFVGVSIHLSAFWGVLSSFVWGFAYVFVGVAIAGRTPGKWLLGLRVVRADGSPVPPGRGAVRSVLWLVSVLVPVLALLPVAFQRKHRAVHDLVAGTAVVHDWGDRPAELSTPLAGLLQRIPGLG